MKEIKLSKEDNRILEVFSMYLQSYGTKVGKCRIVVETDNETYWGHSDWDGDSTRVTIDSYQAIDELLNKIFNEYKNNFLEYFGYEDRGGVTFIVNCNNKTMSFKADVYVHNTNYFNEEYSFDDISNEEIKDWLSEMSQSFTSGNIHYEGSGDSGYIEEDIRFNDNSRSGYPNQLEDWMYRELNQFGGWEINEGSQGDFHFNFDKGIISLRHGENYEDEEIHEIPLVINF